MSRAFLTPLILPGDPVNPLEAAPKQYVDGKTHSLTAGGDLTGTYPNPTLSSSIVQAMRANVQDEGVDQALDIAVLNFKGAGVTAAQDSLGVAGITISGVPPDGSVTNAKLGTGAVDSTKIGFNSIYQGHITDGEVILSKLAADTKNLAVGVPSLRKLGTGNTDAAAGDHTHVGLAPALNMKNQDNLLTNAPTGMNFKGAGVTATGTTEIQITIPGLPIGGMLMWPAATAPVTGGTEVWLLCDGASYPNATYPVLAPILRATAAFVVDASNFRTPDLIRRVPVGAGGGIVVGRSDPITTANAATRSFAHNHGTGNVGHTGTVNTSTGGTGTRVNTIAGSNDGVHSHTVTNSAFDDIPSMCLNFIIRAA